MITRDKEAEILRLYHAERWRVGTIARALAVHHTTVQRVLQQSGTPQRIIAPRPSIAESFVGLIVETLEKYPKLTAQRLYEMARHEDTRAAPITSGAWFHVIGRDPLPKPINAFRPCQARKLKSIGRTSVECKLEPQRASCTPSSWC